MSLELSSELLDMLQWEQGHARWLPCHSLQGSGIQLKVKLTKALQKQLSLVAVLDEITVWIFSERDEHVCHIDDGAA